MALRAMAGSFAQSVATGNQDVTGVGFTPLGGERSALLMWTAAGTVAGTFRASTIFGLGFAVTDRALACSVASQDAQATSAARRRQNATAISLVDWASVVVGEATLASWITDGFRLNWSVVDGNGYIHHYLLFDGEELEAKVIDFFQPAATGVTAVRNVGFAPDLVFIAQTVNSTGDVSTGGGADITFGALDSSLNQWAVGLNAANGAAVTDTQRIQRTNRCIAGIDTAAQLNRAAAIDSIHGDGFNLDWSVVGFGPARYRALCLRGLKGKVGAFNKSTGAAPASQASPSIGFSPAAFMLVSNQNITDTSGKTHARLGVGASSGAAAEQSCAFSDTNALETSSVDALDKTDKCFLKVDNDTATINAEADTSSLDSDGFTLSWSTNDAVATEMLYAAVGSPTPSHGSSIPADMDVSIGHSGDGAMHADGHIKHLYVTPVVLSDEEITDLP